MLLVHEGWLVFRHAYEMRFAVVAERIAGRWRGEFGAWVFHPAAVTRARRLITRSYPYDVIANPDAWARVRLVLPPGAPDYRLASRRLASRGPDGHLRLHLEGTVLADEADGIVLELVNVPVPILRRERRPYEILSRGPHGPAPLLDATRRWSSAARAQLRGQLAGRTPAQLGWVRHGNGPDCAAANTRPEGEPHALG